MAQLRRELEQTRLSSVRAIEYHDSPPPPPPPPPSTLPTTVPTPPKLPPPNLTSTKPVVPSNQEALLASIRNPGIALKPVEKREDAPIDLSNEDNILKVLAHKLMARREVLKESQENVEEDDELLWD
jgi:hypothetical protein